jgi:hypothetical protein
VRGQGVAKEEGCGEKMKKKVYPKKKKLCCYRVIIDPSLFIFLCMSLSSVVCVGL